ncbi:nicotinate-nucleotide-dimethylbenzimidazole phosphoribosyltransferase [Komagataeibacter xylinus NBRC 13693]|uniref:Nicotinate-nucleotide--dimethylbenzimidazole phosphoribosyltransferase n=1 Tax=Komagataeibacter xylinus NBRC 13693 TaxID=1234668 RepID=A0A0D6Q917_KOMXY|nr:nicotinate-nucleotide--dimethylbenzimidazole phosphoribosyltransferase [Komagataeibacter xylinus]GAO00028.1 nicotinate-nucleotide-dimethylbenzimidazole phosphoribosyltransferase [Komagataeibacter xylinus NBRC 13693]
MPSRLSFPRDMAALRQLCRDLPPPDMTADAAIADHDSQLTKPPGSLGRLEELARWAGRWQHTDRPRAERVDIIVFAGNHGVTAQGVTPWPVDVTRQMVENFRNGGAAINQIARVSAARLHVVDVEALRPTADMTRAPAMDEPTFLRALTTGMRAVRTDTDLLCLGEMGIGNSTAASAVCAALFGGGGAKWAGRGTGLDDAGVRHKAAVIDRALACHDGHLSDPLAILRHLGGHELAAIMGAVIAARYRNIPVLLDGFICTAAAAPLALLHPSGLAHTRLSHCSAEGGHAHLAVALGLSPLLDLGLRLGEGSGAGLAIPLVRSAIACLCGMATFAQARVSEKE